MKTYEKKPRYASRKLKIGLVSCLLGFSIMVLPYQSLAAGGVEGENSTTGVVEAKNNLEPTKKEEEQKSSKAQSLETESSEAKSPLKDEANPKESSSQTGEGLDSNKNQAEVNKQGQTPKDGGLKDEEKNHEELKKEKNQLLSGGLEVSANNIGQPVQASENKDAAELTVEIELSNGNLVKTNENTYESGAGVTVIGGLGGISKETQEALKNIKFNILEWPEGASPQLYKSNVKAELGDPHRWSGALYIKGLEKNKRYIFQVVNDSIPDGYYYWFSKSSGDPFKTINMQIYNKQTLAVLDTSKTNNGEKYGYARLNLQVLDIIFARNEETAKNIFVKKTEGTTDRDKIKRNDQLKEGVDYYKTRLQKNYDVSIPSIETYQNEGYKPLGWYIKYEDSKGVIHKDYIETLKDKHYNVGEAFRGMYDGQDEINYTKLRKKAHTIVFTLDQKLPKVTFNFNNSDGANPSEEVDQNVYYLKSLATNRLENGQQIVRKDLKPSKKGYRLVGWNTKADGSGQAFDENTIVNDDMKVYAIWQKVEPEKKPEPKTPYPYPYPLYKPEFTIDEGGDDMTDEIIDNLDKEKPEPVENKLDDLKKNDEKDQIKEEEKEQVKEEEKETEPREDDLDMNDPSSKKIKAKDSKSARTNPKTGIAGSTSILGLGISASLLSLVFKKKNDEY